MVGGGVGRSGEGGAGKLEDELVYTHTHIYI